MDNKKIVKLVTDFRGNRDAWINRLTENRDSVDVAQHIVSINAKIEVLLSFWDWYDETIDYPSSF